jgi:YVTN family beta-propeller protein
MPRYLVPLLLAVLVTACDTVDPLPPASEPETTGIVVASQGAFGQDTGGVVRYNLDGTAAARYPGGGAGLYVQSADLHDGRLFVTTTSTVDVLDAQTLQRTARLDVPNPRYLAFDGHTAYVTSLYTDLATFGDGAVTRLVVATTGEAVGEQVVVGGNPEGIAVTGGRVYVANHDWGAGTTVTVLNANTLAEITRIEVCEGPRFVFTDRQGEVVVVCEGGGFGEDATNGAFVVLHGPTGAQVARVDLPTPLRTAGSGQTAVYVPELQEVYAVYDAGRTVYRFNTAANALAATLDVGGAPINAVAYDAARQYLLLGRFATQGNPYDAQGTLTIHTRQGALVDTFHGAGIAPTHVTVITETPE